MIIIDTMQFLRSYFDNCFCYPNVFLLSLILSFVIIVGCVYVLIFSIYSLIVSFQKFRAKGLSKAKLTSKFIKSYIDKTKLRLNILSKRIISYLPIIKGIFPTFLLLLISAFLYLTIIKLGRQQFPGMDGSVLIDGAWQYLLGYKPYQDFITIVSPGFLIGAKLGFGLFGVNWDALVKITAFYSTVLFIWEYLLLTRLGINFLVAFLLSLCVQILTNVDSSFWWYNQITASTSVIFITSTILYLRSAKFLLSLSLLLSTILLLLMKPNIAAFLLICIYSALLFPRGRAKVTILLAFLTIVFVLIILLISGINPWQVFLTYLSSSGRLDVVYMWGKLTSAMKANVEALQSLVFSIPIIVAFCYFLDSLKTVIQKAEVDKKILLYFFLISFLTSILGFCTNTDHKINELPIFIVTFYCTAYLLSIRKKIKIILLIGVMVISIHGFNLAMQRMRIKAVGDFYDKNMTLYQGSNKFFVNLYTSERFLNTLSNLEALDKLIGLNNYQETILFGPRLTFSYAMFNLVPQKRQPLWWGETAETGGVPKGMQRKLAQNIYDETYKLIVTYQSDFTFYPYAIVGYIQERYLKIKFGSLDVYIKPSEQQIITSLKQRI